MEINFGITAFKNNHQIKAANIGRVLEIHGRSISYVDKDVEQYQETISNKKLHKFRYSRMLVGDFLELNHDKQIINIFPRDNVLSKANSVAKKSFRKKTKEQEIAANVDQIIVMIAVNQHFTIEKLERYLETFQLQGREPIVLLSKVDFEEERNKVVKMIKQAYPTLKVYEVSVFRIDTLKEIEKLFEPEKTIAVIGSSGIGKSTLLNKLNNQQQVEVGAVRKGDQKGKHTTTATSLHALKQLQAYYLDTPGFKTISSNLNHADPKVFDDIKELAQKCKFRNCRHLSEPRCAVKAAVEAGIITKDHYTSYLKFEQRNG